MPAMLVTRDTRFPDKSDASTSRMSPVGRSIVKAGALGLEGEEKMYESEAIWTLMSRNGSAMVEGRGSKAQAKDGKGGWLNRVPCVASACRSVDEANFRKIWWDMHRP
jgi:hypothetical protein